MYVRRTLWIDKRGAYHVSTDRGAYHDRRLVLIAREGGTIVSIRNIND